MQREELPELSLPPRLYFTFETSTESALILQAVKYLLLDLTVSCGE